MLLSAAALLVAAGSSATAKTIAGALPWEPNAGNSPLAAKIGPWEFFTGDEGRAMEALADRIIPPDPHTTGGKDSGSAVFVDRQLAGDYGKQEGHYVRPPFIKGLKSQGPQSGGGPQKEYRDGLAALDKACQAREGGKRFADLSDDSKDAVLKDIEENVKVQKASHIKFAIPTKPPSQVTHTRLLQLGKKRSSSGTGHAPIKSHAALQPGPSIAGSKSGSTFAKKRDEMAGSP